VYKGNEPVWQPGQQPAVTSLNSGPAALLDSGSTLSHVPQDVLNLLVSLFDVTQTANSDGLYVGPCANANEDISIEFGFGNGAASISVPASQMFRPYDTAGEVCALGFNATTSLPYILGDTFLTSAYLVYDFDAYTISMAQAKWT